MADLDIVLPVYNPKNGWEETVIESIEKINQINPDLLLQIIIVNDGSDINVDQFKIEKIEEKIGAVTYINHEKNKGKGAAVKSGFRQSTAEIVLFTDIDFPYEEKHIIEIYDQVKHHKANIAIGIRQTSYNRKVITSRRVLSALIQIMNKSLLGMKDADTQAGIKAFDKKGKEQLLALNVDRYLFDLELLLKASRNESIKISKITVWLKSDVEVSKFKLRILLQETWNYIKILKIGWLNQ